MNSVPKTRTSAQKYNTRMDKIWERCKEANKQNMQYPEFENAVDMITDSTCNTINDFAKSIKSEMPYKAQYLLEEVIKKLQERV
jgi:hypothetical protein